MTSKTKVVVVGGGVVGVSALYHLAKNKSYYKFQWVVEKYYEQGPLKDCWLTTSVSTPVSLGSSI